MSVLTIAGVTPQRAARAAGRQRPAARRYNAPADEARRATPLTVGPIWREE
jgi:hypothetical protein